MRTERVTTRSTNVTLALATGLLLSACATDRGAQGGAATTGAPAAPVVVAGDTVPAGTRITARIDEDIGTKESRVGQPYTATVTTPIVDPQGSAIVAADVSTHRGGPEATHVLAGALGGAVLGAILGDTTGALVGGAAGAVAGTLISLGTRPEEARIPAGSAIAVELRAPVDVAGLRGATPRG